MAEQAENTKKSKKSKKRSNIVFTIFMICVCSILGFAILKQYQLKLDLDSREAILQEELKKQQNTKEALENEMKNKNSPELIERIAREKLNMVKPNEIVFNDTNSGKRQISNTDE